MTKGTEGPGGVLSVQQVGFESSEQDVAVDPLAGDGLQDFVLVGSQRFAAERVDRVPGPVDGRSGFLAVQPGEPIEEVLTAAPSGAPLGGVKVVTRSGWFAARPSGTEDVYKLYAESFRGPAHLAEIQEEAQAIIAAAIG